MLSSIFCDPMECDTFLQELEDDEAASMTESLDKSELSLSLKDLSDSIHCGTIAAVSVSKHVIEETGREVWKVDKVGLRYYWVFHLCFPELKS